MIIPPKRSEKWTEDGLPSIRFAEAFEEMARVVNGLEVAVQPVAPGGGAGAGGGGAGAGGGAGDGGGGGLPPVPVDPAFELPYPHWLNLSTGMTYNHTNLNQYTTRDFAAVFGLPIEDRVNFQGNITVASSGTAIKINTVDPDQFLSIIWGVGFNRASIVLADSAGNIVGWCFVSGQPGVFGGSVAIPSDGADYYAIIMSDTNLINVSMWDVTP